MNLYIPKNSYGKQTIAIENLHWFFCHALTLAEFKIFHEKAIKYIDKHYIICYTDTVYVYIFVRSYNIISVML